MTDFSSNGFIHRYRFWLVFILAAALLQIPIISIPFKWFESYFHEISHGLAAIATGGAIVKIELFPNGAGLCTTMGGSRFFTSFMGYAGAAIWGMLLYASASYHQRMAQVVHVLVAGLLVCSLLLWVRDSLTFVIVAILLSIVLLKFKYSHAAYLQFSMQILGALVLINSLYSPFYLLAYNQQGDSATLASLTLIPELMWIAIWFSIGVASMVFLAKNDRVKRSSVS